MTQKTRFLILMMVVITVMTGMFPRGTAGARGDAFNAAEVAAFIDGFWSEKIQPLGIPGAVFVLVKDGQIRFSKGYGLADVEKGMTVDPGETLFGIGSVSKAVTASAVLQLVERGQLRLDEPVNHYLKSFQIEKTCEAPVTTAHLLTHTAGFDERVIGGMVLSADQLTPLADYVARDLPPCIRPPGQEMSYCNHCYALAGLLVQEISNQPFEQYVEENIFKPLEMQQSSFQQPLPAELEGLRATGYIFAPTLQPAPQVYINGFPSGGMWASGEDMGRFIIAQLQGGLSGGEQVFNPETRAQMQQRQFSQDPRLEGWTYGFFEQFENGERLIGKDGDVPGFSSSLHMLPEHNLGFFLSYNATVPFKPGVTDPRLIFPSAFLDHFFPASEPLQPAKPEGEARRLAGTYRWSRFGHTSIDKIISPMLLLQWQVRSNPDGSISLAYPALMGGQTSRWWEVEPGLFQNTENSSYLTYKLGHIYTKIGEEGVLERVAWYETLTFQAGLLVLMSVVFISVLVVLGVRAVRRRQGAHRAAQAGAHRAPLLAGILAGLNLLFLGGLALAVAQSTTTRAPQVPAYFVGILVIPVVTGLLALLLLGVTLLAWKDRRGSLASRVFYTLATLAGLAFTWFAYYWNLLGFKL
jgi:CubicO group peptidase (beta-lactamase class C family)